MSQEKKKNIGGAAQKRELTLAQIEELQNFAYSMGVESGREAEKRAAHPEFNSCPMCAMRRELEAAKVRLRVIDNSEPRRSRPFQ